MIDYNALLLAAAILLTGMALVIVFVIYISQRVGLRSRIVAMIVDIAIIRLVVDLVLAFLNPGYYSLFTSAVTVFSLNPLASLFIVVMAIGESVSSYLFFYISFFYGVFGVSMTSVLVAIFGFLYFFVCDAFFEGKTVGRRILKLKTHHESKDRALSFGEAGINAIGKAFLLLDLILGQLISVFDSRNPELKQVRLTQKLARVVTIDPSVSIPSDGNNSDPFLRDDDKSGELW